VICKKNESMIEMNFEYLKERNKCGINGCSTELKMVNLIKFAITFFTIYS